MAAFDREAFRNSLLDRAMHQTLSAREKMFALPVDRPATSSARQESWAQSHRAASPCSQSSGALTDRPRTGAPPNTGHRGGWAHRADLEPTTPRTILMERAIRSSGGYSSARKKTASEQWIEAMHEREGPMGRPITRIPENKWYLRNETSSNVRDTEYNRTYCMDRPNEQLDTMLNMTFNDQRIQRDTKVNLQEFPRSELRAAMMGWGPKMRQVYVPELRTDSAKLHAHYAALGIPHEYRPGTSSGAATERGAGGRGSQARADPAQRQAMGQSSRFAEGSETSLLVRRPPQTAQDNRHPSAGGKRPSIKALQDGQVGVSGNSPRTMHVSPNGDPALLTGSSSMTTRRSANVSPTMAATEYRGQYADKSVSPNGFMGRSQMLLDGPVDFDEPDAFQTTKQSIRQRQAYNVQTYTSAAELKHSKDVAKAFNTTVDKVFHEKALRNAEDTYGIARNSPKRHRPGRESPPRIPHLAALQKDLEWQPDPEKDPKLLSLTGKAGPSELTANRRGFYGIQQAHSPRQTIKWGNTRTDRQSHYALEVNVEGKSMGFSVPERRTIRHNADSMADENQDGNHEANSLGTTGSASGGDRHKIKTFRNPPEPKLPQRYKGGIARSSGLLTKPK